MSGVLAPQWIFQALTDAGDVASGARLFSFVGGGGSVPSPLYADKALTTPLANPYEFDSAGRGQFWLDSSITYRLRLETATGVLIEERDGVEGAAGMATLANNTDPAKGAGLIGWIGQTVGYWINWIKWRLDGSVSILQYIPVAEHAAILGGTSTYDCTSAWQQMHDDTPPGTVMQIIGRINIYSTVYLTKSSQYYIGSGSGIDGAGTMVIRRADVVAFEIGNSGPTGPFINAPWFSHIQFRSPAQTGPIWTNDFFKINATILGGLKYCYLTGDHAGAWLSLRRMQDMWIHACLFRGGGHEAGTKAQIVFEEPQGLYDGDGALLEMFYVNSIRATSNHHEWGPSGGGTYVNPVTGATETGNRGSRLLRVFDTSGTAGASNLFKMSNSKAEMAVSWPGVAAFDIDRCSGYQITGCEFNQTRKIFDVRNSEGIIITGTYNNTTVASPLEFGDFTNCDNPQISVFGYNMPRPKFMRCPGIVDETATHSLASSASRDFAMDKERYRGLHNQHYFASQTGVRLAEDIRALGGSNRRSPELSTGTFGYSLLGLRPTVRKNVPEGMTLRVLACTESAPVGSIICHFAYTYSPDQTVYKGDGATVTWAIPRYFAQETETGYSGIPNVSALKRHRLTGAETALTISVMAGDDGNLNGGTITVTEAVTADYDVIISRAALGKTVLPFPLGGSLSTTPTWYECVVPPGVLSLENVILHVKNATEEAGLRILILDWDLVEGATSPTTMFYPTSLVAGGGGLVPGGNGWGEGATVWAKDTVAAGCIGWTCTDPAGGNGEGVWRPIPPGPVSRVLTGAGGTVLLPDSADYTASGARRSYTNAGTGDYSIECDGTDTIFGSSATAVDLPIGQTVTLEYIGSGAWAIVSGAVSSGTITFSGSVTQAIPAGTTPIKLTCFGTNEYAVNLTADQANDKLTTTIAGVYDLSAMWSGYVGTAADAFLGIFVDGVLADVTTMEKFGATGSTQTESIQSSASLYIAEGKDIDLRVYHSDAASNSFVTTRALLSAKRIA